MTSASRWRVGTTLGVGLVVAIVMVVLGMEPRLAVVACIVAAVGAATWLIADLGATADPVMWSDVSGLPDAGTTTDRRVQVLSGSLRRGVRNARVLGVGAGDQVASDEIADTLLGLIDDHLLSEYGIDRTVDPDAATEPVDGEPAVRPGRIDRIVLRA